MATIKERLKADTIEAMKNKEKERLEAIRFLSAAIKKIEVDTRKDLDDAAVIAIITTQVKQRRDSIDQFTKGGRQDLVAKEETELKLLQSYLPQQLTREELSKIVADTVAAVGATGPKDMGAVMKALMPKVAGKAEGSVISEIVKAKLSP